jgi:hypothetical protein
MPFATEVATEQTIGTTDIGDTLVMPTIVKPNRRLTRPMVLRMAQLCSKYTGGTTEAMMTIVLTKAVQLWATSRAMSYNAQAFMQGKASKQESPGKRGMK